MKSQKQNTDANGLPFFEVPPTPLASVSFVQAWHKLQYRRDVLRRMEEVKAPKFLLDQQEENILRTTELIWSRN